jgi:hypothetical protein
MRGPLSLDMDKHKNDNKQWLQNYQLDAAPPTPPKEIAHGKKEGENRRE